MNKTHHSCTHFAGIKFLWWTWHDTDAPIDYRILGVPIGSTVWVITFTGDRNNYEMMFTFSLKS